jgi:hypothetical protein
MTVKQFYRAFDKIRRASGFRWGVFGLRNVDGVCPIVAVANANLKDDVAYSLGSFRFAGISVDMSPIEIAAIAEAADVNQEAWAKVRRELLR